MTALRKQARPPHDEIASHLNDGEVVDFLIRVTEAVKDPTAIPALTSLESEKKKWGKKRAEEVAAQEQKAAAAKPE